MRNALLAAIVAGLTACTTTPDPNSTKAASGAIAHDLTAGQARLAARLYPELARAAEPNDNLFVSPLSLSEGLGLALLGARGQTETEMRALLGWDPAARPELLVKAYDDFLTRTGDDKVALSVANALWLSDKLTFEEGFLRTTRTAFGATADTVDFGRNPQRSADRINSWVAKETRERITKIVEASGFGNSTAAVLTNAVWFKADWSVPFEDGSFGQFTRGDGSRIGIYMMERLAPMQYRETRDGQAVALPYGKDGRFVMEVFLPKDAATLRKWESELASTSFSIADQGSDGKYDLGAGKEQTILLRLPRFEARFDQSVRDALIAAGMPCAFAGTCAEFSGMARGPLKIDDVAHATFLRVDEEGTEAAAVTAVKIIVVGGRRMPDVPRMIVDRPFLVSIRDRASGALIFFGRIADPTPVEKAP